MKNKFHKFTIYRIPEKKIEFEENFNLNTARWLLEFSALSYLENIEEINNQLKKCRNINLVKMIKVDDAECLILNHEDILIISFSGTKLSEIDDIITDLKFWKTEFEKLYVHKGFHDYYYKLKFPVLREILKLNKLKKYQLYWTGHSLGGALATLFGYVYKEGVVYTYGKPKIGNKDFSNEVNRTIKCYRVYNNLDIIPNLPPGFLKYTHEGNEVLGVLDLENISFKNILEIFLSKIIGFIPEKFFREILLSIFNLRRGFLFHSLNSYRKMLWSKNFKIFAEI